MLPAANPPPPVQIPAQVVPKHAKRFKAADLRTILEEKILSMDGVIERYPKVWKLIKYHKFHVFTKPRGSYVPSWVREFYIAFEAALPKIQRKLRESELIDVVRVQGKKVKCGSLDINAELGCSKNIRSDLVDKLKEELDDMKG